ncbi:hypothetical protein CK203_060465 [Vitis vinifera]|uniref:Uncharacterized protein n=1 Tax=Vitis vinifera TaxID=29760 RepID=A0A438GJS0_VITVI|nr:hypothetical protein CK203_060465 [Vitis vinifera]
MTPREFFYPRVAMDFYQSMTTQGAQSPIAIHFSIDGCQGILEARHIAEALHILDQLEDLAHFRQWSLYLSETWSASYQEGLMEIHSFYDELPVDFVPPTLAAPSMPQATFTDPPATPHIPPTAPPTSEDFITVSGTEFRAMIHQHLGLSPPQTDIPRPSEPIALAEDTTPAQETHRADVPPQATHEAATEPSSPPENPAP